MLQADLASRQNLKFASSKPLPAQCPKIFFLESYGRAAKHLPTSYYHRDDVVTGTAAQIALAAYNYQAVLARLMS